MTKYVNYIIAPNRGKKQKSLNKFKKTKNILKLKMWRYHIYRFKWRLDLQGQKKNTKSFAFLITFFFNFIFFLLYSYCSGTSKEKKFDFRKLLNPLRVPSRIKKYTAKEKNSWISNELQFGKRPNLGAPNKIQFRKEYILIAGFLEILWQIWETQKIYAVARSRFSASFINFITKNFVF